MLLDSNQNILFNKYMPLIFNYKYQLDSAFLIINNNLYLEMDYANSFLTQDAIETRLNNNQFIITYNPGEFFNLHNEEIITSSLKGMSIWLTYAKFTAKIGLSPLTKPDFIQYNESISATSPLQPAQIGGRSSLPCLEYFTSKTTDGGVNQGRNPEAQLSIKPYYSSLNSVNKGCEENHSIPLSEHLMSNGYTKENVIKTLQAYGLRDGQLSINETNFIPKKYIFYLPVKDLFNVTGDAAYLSNYVNDHNSNMTPLILDPTSIEHMEKIKYVFENFCRDCLEKNPHRLITGFVPSILMPINEVSPELLLAFYYIVTYNFYQELLTLQNIKIGIELHLCNDLFSKL